MEDYVPRSSVVPVAAGLILSWIVAPTTVLFGIDLAGLPTTDSGRQAIPIDFLALGFYLVGFIFLLVGLFRVLKTVDFLGRREAARMEDEDYRAGYRQR